MADERSSTEAASMVLGEQTLTEMAAKKEISIAEITEAVNVLGSAGIELTPEQKMMVNKLVLIDSINQNAEEIFNRYNARMSALGFDAAAIDIFHDLIKGAFMLEGAQTVIERMIVPLVATSDDEFKAEVGKINHIPELLNAYGVDSVDQMFEKLKETGKTPVYYYDSRSEEYVLLELNEEQRAVLPWGGVIRFGGPDDTISDTFSITRDFIVDYSWRSLNINGVDFDAPPSNPRMS